MTTYIENSNADWKLNRTDAFLIQVTPLKVLLKCGVLHVRKHGERTTIGASGHSNDKHFVYCQAQLKL